LVRDAELADEPVERPRFLERVQVLALDVLDERHRDGGFIGHAPDDGGHGLEARDLGRAPPAFARDDLVALRLARCGTVHRTHDDGLHDALRLDRRRQLFQGFLAHVHARLVFAPLQQIDREIGQLIARKLRGRRCRSVWRGCRPRGGFRPPRDLSQQGLEAAAHDRFLRAHGGG
jgi:hypothetical protein